MTAETGVSFLGSGGKMSGTISGELGFSTSTAVEEFENETTTRRLTTPPQKAAALWAISYYLRLVHMDGTIVGSPLAFEVDAFHQSQYPPVSPAQA